MTSARSAAPAAPRVLVLLATHNGVRWLDEQVDSILDQRGVSVRLWAMDDSSSDGTAQWLRERAAREPRLTVLDDTGTAGSSVANFARLIAAAVPEPGELVSFADQDDVWHPDKLASHAAILAAGSIDGVSSSVTSFYEDGRRALVRKDYPQREFDYVLESPGPGCTFLITPRLLELTRATLETEAAARQVDYHDSLIYAIARGRGWGWYIDGVPSVDYRQHSANVLGANIGARSALGRLALIREHWLHHHTIALTRVALSVAPAERRPGLQRILGLLEGRGIRSRFALARLAPRMRRRPRDQWIIAVLITIGVW